MQTTQTTETARPWWAFGHVWMVIAGPATVVVASIATFFVAVHGVDPVINENYYQEGLKLSKPATSSMLPAVDARNQAAAHAMQQSHEPADQ